MARQTRAQRKARREQQGNATPVRRDQQGDGGLPERRSRQPAPRPEPDATDGAPAARASGGGRRFIAESWGELQKVEWPGQKQVTQGTIVVLIACVIVGAYLWGADLVLKRLVQNILLGQ